MILWVWCVPSYSSRSAARCFAITIALVVCAHHVCVIQRELIFCDGWGRQQVCEPAAKCVCVTQCVCVCVCVCVSVFACGVCVTLCVCVSAYVCGACVCLCVCVCVCICVCVCASVIVPGFQPAGHGEARF